MAAEADSSAAAASGSHRRLSSSDSLKQSGNLTRGQNGIERESKELEWNASRDNEALSGSRAVFGHPDSFSMDGATDETYDYAATNSFRPQPAPFLPLQCYDGEFAPPVADDDQPGVLKGTSADYYSPSIPSEAFGMITQPTMAANPPVHSPSRGSSLRYNVKQMFRRKSGRDRTLSSTTSPTEHTGSMPSAAVPHLEGATPMQHIITDGHHVESPTNVSPTSMTMPDFPASQASQAPMSPPSSSSPDAMVKTPPLSPFSERQARKAPSPPMYAAPGTVNPMDIMPASTESEVWHRTEHQLYTSTNETTKPQPNDYDSTMPSPSPTPPDSQDLATELLAQPFTATDQGFTYTTDPAEPTYAVDSVMPDVPDYHHLHPTASPEGRHPSYPSEHSTPYPGHAFTDVSSQNTPSTQIDSPSPQSLGSSDFRHSVSPQPVLSVPSPKNGVFHCDEPGCQQVFDQPHKLKYVKTSLELSVTKTEARLTSYSGTTSDIIVKTTSAPMLGVVKALEPKPTCKDISMTGTRRRRSFTAQLQDVIILGLVVRPFQERITGSGI